MVVYRAVAEGIVLAAYGLVGEGSYSVRSLLEVSGSEEEVAHILCEDAAKQASRLEQLDKGFQAVLQDYERRRLRCPLKPASVAGSYTAAFAPRSDGVDSDLLARLRLTPKLREHLYSVGDQDFEEVCGTALRLIGCTGVTVSRRSKDEGVDAIAALPLAPALEEGTPLFRLVGSLSFLVFSQAKAYAKERPLQQQEVFKVQGSWEAIRNECADGTAQPDIRLALRKADFRSADPVLLVLMTTSSFTAGALRKGTSTGMLLLDGEQIAHSSLRRHWALRRMLRGPRYSIQTLSPPPPPNPNVRRRA